ncbi:MAG TPA: SurA N-terminal domain-containing protein [Candidatus Saccharicenans sp.]|jgi:peptidyl-prolyl cis-trans isomerase D|nr:SurA N-terminal domain-containing protein [Candidatus Saccharicenans sp.]HRD02931.1 SurA N-terminal domain-containing protein [Candidatus Saccharicenans sp.]
MLKTMRKNLKSLSPILWIVIATFIIAIFAVWGGAGRLGESRQANSIIQVGSHELTTQEFAQILQQRITIMKNQYPELKADLIRQLNLHQQILQQLVQQYLLLDIAREMGLKASDKEIQQKIVSYPVFQREGKFVGFKEYQQILDWNHIPVQKFEQSLAEEILLEKVTRLLTAGCTVSENEVWENYKNQNETAKIEYLVVTIDKIQLDSNPSENELQSYFEQNKQKYRVPERRQGKYVFLKIDDLKKEITVSDGEIEKYYKDNINQFKEPAKIKVSRIYLPYSEADKQQILNQGEQLKGHLSEGEDFGLLARTYSKDDRASNGGDWGYYDWQSLSSTELEAINQLEAGQISGVIDLGEGVAILKVTEKMPEITRSLAEVKAMIQNHLQEEKARDKVSQRMENLAKVARKARNLEEAARREGLSIQDTGWLKNGDPLPGVDSSGVISQALFELKEGEISSPIFTYESVAVVQFTQKDLEHQASLEEIRTHVLEDLIKEKKRELAQARLNSIRLSQETNWEEVARINNLEYKIVETYKHGQYLSLIDEAAELEQLVFSLPLNQVSEPISVGNGYAVVRVLDRKEVSREDFEKVKGEEMAKALSDAQEMFLYSYLQKAIQERKVKVNYDLFSKTADEVLNRFGE